MSSDKVLFEEQDDIAIIKLNRPEKRNALDPETVLLFNDYSKKAKDKKYKSVVITGNGGAFCAGADLDPQVTLWAGKALRKHSMRDTTLD